MIVCVPFTLHSVGVDAEVELVDLWKGSKVEGVKLAPEPSTRKAKLNDVACGIARDAQP